MRRIKNSSFAIISILFCQNIAVAQEIIQVDIKPLLNIRMVTTSTNNKVVLWKDALDGGESGMATMSAAKSLADPKPAEIRYSWSSNPSDANLYNKEGFPASPFRTDTWPLPTNGFKYMNWIK